MEYFDLDVNNLFISELHLKNFRCFECLQISFSTPYTILIGNNGVGKSAILDALRIALDSFVTTIQFDVRKYMFRIAGINIQGSDAKINSVTAGSTANKVSQLPVTVSVTAKNSKGKNLSWTDKFSSNVLDQNHSGLKKIFKYVSKLQGQLVRGDNIICPVVTYYGTQRHWDSVAENTNKEGTINSPFLSQVPRVRGYTNCLATKPFDIGIMRHWFSRMLLIERKKLVPEFQAVRIAIANCYKNIDNGKNIREVTIDYDAEVEDIEIQQTFVDGKFEILPLHYLSDGAKSILAIAADIAYRMAVLNPHLLDKVIEETDGVVLIDEIDMHLHPSWQHKVVESLHKTFPKVQFILTTHSPTILTNIPKENIRILNAGKIYTPSVYTKGRDVNSILREVMQTEIRPSDISEKLATFSKAIEDENLDAAKEILEDLRVQLGDNDSEVVGAQVTLDLERL